MALERVLTKFRLTAGIYMNFSKEKFLTKIKTNSWNLFRLTIHPSK